MSVWFPHVSVSVHLCSDSSTLCWSFYTDLRLGGLTEVSKSGPSLACVEIPDLLSPFDIDLVSFVAGLSSFQQSVAMDRLQRILGMIQKPEMG